MFVNDLPPSVVLYTPSPYAKLRCELFSPVPTQTTFELLGSMAKHPIEKTGWSSNIGSKVVP